MTDAGGRIFPLGLFREILAYGRKHHPERDYTVAESNLAKTELMQKLSGCACDPGADFSVSGVITLWHSESCPAKDAKTMVCDSTKSDIPIGAVNGNDA